MLNIEFFYHVLLYLCAMYIFPGSFYIFVFDILYQLNHSVKMFVFHYQ